LSLIEGAMKILSHKDKKVKVVIPVQAMEALRVARG
jgi:hypothetical protein